METCRLLGGYLDTIAAKNPETKFVSIVGDKCIPNYPDRNLPTLLIYRNGDLHRQIIGLRPEIGLDGMNTKLADVELLLTAVGAIDRPDPRKGSASSTSQQGETTMRMTGTTKSGEVGSGMGRRAGPQLHTVRNLQKGAADGEPPYTSTVRFMGYSSVQRPPWTGCRRRSTTEWTDEVEGSAHLVKPARA
ncbi:Proteolipid protein 2 [Tilletia horrida]|uniref:Proteolipid protein 2 n=1 Tax=Tilletia horrida TaxID=155126 RepID=A0AAN6G8S1_9BASI|nr:Proteolipid protein 2 [Tilletia horrida]